MESEQISIRQDDVLKCPLNPDVIQRIQEKVTCSHTFTRYADSSGQLLHVLDRELVLLQDYQDLINQYGNTLGKTPIVLAQESLQRIKCLRALYFLLSGIEYNTHAPSVPRRYTLPETLRNCLHTERLNAECCRCTVQAETVPELQAFWSDMLPEKLKHIRLLFHLIASL